MFFELFWMKINAISVSFHRLVPPPVPLPPELVPQATRIGAVMSIADRPAIARPWPILSMRMSPHLSHFR